MEQENNTQHKCEQCWHGACWKHGAIRGSLHKVAWFAILAIAIWAGVSAISGVLGWRFIGTGVPATNTINVSGEGEVFAVPDIGTFSVTLTKEGKDVASAQTEATEVMNAIIGYLKDAGVDEKDIKTTSYNANPRYEWRDGSCAPGSICTPGTRTLVGYEVSQTIAVKVRDTKKAGEILSGVGNMGATNVSGLSFTIDDDSSLLADAREKAIADAQEKAERLADELDVRLVRVVGFYENTGDDRYYAKAYGMGGDVMMESAAAPMPEIPTGENRIISNVSITYEIR